MSTRNERLFVLCLCLVAGLRMFLGATAMPPFNDIDETLHFDLVHKFAGGEWPSLRAERWDQETVRLRLLYGSPEFLNAPSSFAGGTIPPPVWSLPPGRSRDRWIANGRRLLEQRVNVEAHSPPVYYVLAAGWYRLGRAFGLLDIASFYWLRLLDVPLFMGLVWATHRFCKAWCSAAVAVMAPLFVALFPNTVFYGVNSDALCPLVFVGALDALMRWSAGPEPSGTRATVSGLLVAAAFLTKLTNVAILAPAAYLFLVKLRALRRAGWPGGAWWRAFVLPIAAALPIAFWLVRNKVVLGDWSGNEAKIHLLGWTQKPLADWIDHPLFSLRGMWFFMSGLVRTFWNGEVSWHGRSGGILLPPADIFFLATSLLFPLVAVGTLVIRRRTAETMQESYGLCALSVAVAVLFLMVVSLPFDFGNCVFPSAEFPFFASGRLLSGVLVPFLILYARGIEVLAWRWPLPRYLAVGVTCLMMFAARLPLIEAMLHSQYNWYHLI